MDDEYSFRPSWMEIAIPSEQPKRYHFRNLVHGWVDAVNPNAMPPEAPAQLYFDDTINELFIVSFLPIAKLAIISTGGHLFKDRYVFCIDEMEEIKKLWNFIGDL